MKIPSYTKKQIRLLIYECCDKLDGISVKSKSFKKVLKTIQEYQQKLFSVK